MRNFHTARLPCILAGAAMVAGCCASSGPAAAGPTATPSIVAPPSASTPPAATQSTTTPTPTPAPTPALTGSFPRRSSTAPTPTPVVGSGASVHSRPAGRCRTGALSADLARVQGAAGSRLSAVVLTNRSQHSCTLYGYGGLQLLDANHRRVPTLQLRSRAVRPRLVLLRPGASAHADVRWPAIALTGDNQSGLCQPEPSVLLVTPPDERRSLSIRWTAGSVCGRGSIDQRPYAPGAAPTPGPVLAVVIAAAGTGGGSGEVVLDWTAVPAATGYRVIRTNAAGGQRRVMATFDITTGRITAAAEVVNIWSTEHSYRPDRGPLTRTDRSTHFTYVDVGAGRRCYRVQAFSAAGNGPLSAASCAAPPGG
jgi:Protein of unknown function (DUF4232)